MINTMRDLNVFDPRFGLQKMIFATTVLLSIGLLMVNAISGRRVLECDHAAGNVKCHLTDKHLLTEARVTEFSSAKLQKAVVISQGKYQSRHGATLVTTQGNFWMSAMDTEQFNEKHRLVDTVNTFLENPQLPTLKVESPYSTLFWIGTGIFAALLALLSFGVTISWRLLNTASCSGQK